MAQEAPRRRAFLRYWLPVLAYVMMIFVVSAQPRLKPPMRFQNGDKIAHIAEYGILGYLLTRALQTTSFLSGITPAAFAAVGIGAAVGASDELFQGSVPGRESSVLDLVADVIGLTLAQIAALWLRRP